MTYDRQKTAIFSNKWCPWPDCQRPTISKGYARLTSQKLALNPAASRSVWLTSSAAFRRGEENTEIAARYPVGHALISRIRTARSWQAEAAEFGWPPAIAHMERLVERKDAA